MINDLSEFKMFEILWDNFCLLKINSTFRQF